jgi:hypothetical protein
MPCFGGLKPVAKSTPIIYGARLMPHPHEPTRLYFLYRDGAPKCIAARELEPLNAKRMNQALDNGKSPYHWALKEDLPSNLAPPDTPAFSSTAQTNVEGAQAQIFKPRGSGAKND